MTMLRSFMRVRRIAKSDY